MTTPAQRAAIALAHADKEVADYAVGLVGDTAVLMDAEERIRNRRRLRLMGLTSLDRSVIRGLLEGLTWERAAAALGLSVEETRARYEETFNRWESELNPDDPDYGDFTIGLRSDADLEGSAAALDAWYGRHAEPWHPMPGPGPVSQALR